MKTTAPESQESKGQKPGSATDQGTKPPDDFPSPDFPIETSGGPSDTGDGGKTVQPPRG